MKQYAYRKLLKNHTSINLFGSLLFIAVLYFSLFVLALIVYGYFTLQILNNTLDICTVLYSSNMSLYRNLNSQVLLFWLLTIFFIIIEIFVMYLFYKKVYQPIIFIKKSINNIVDEKDEIQLNIDSGNELYSAATGINTIKARIRELLDREYTAKLLKKQAELNALQSQINPHFLYNTLESIRSQALIEGVDGIAKKTKALSAMFRYSISQKESIVIFAQELKNTENYLTIQQYRFFNKFIIIKNFDENDSSIIDCKIPNLTIQPIVENAIYHGLEKKSSTGTIKISAYSTQNRIIISIEDDGLGMSEQQVKEHNRIFNINQEQIVASQRFEHDSVGLFNVNEHIKLNFGAEYGLHIYSTLGIGTNVEITLPKHSSHSL